MSHRLLPLAGLTFLLAAPLALGACGDSTGPTAGPGADHPQPHT